MKKVAVAIACVLALLISAAPFFAILGIHLRHKHQMELLLSQTENALEEKLVLSAQEYLGLEAGDEIEINNQRYDIKSVKKHQNQLEIVAINDRVEKQLIAHLNLSHKQNQPAGKSFKTAVFDWVNQRFLVNIEVKSQACEFYSFIVYTSDRIAAELFLPPRV